jgi:uncharacterized protein YuzE
MTVTIAGTSFDHHEYDKRGDVLYLSVGPPRGAGRTIATPEGHAVDYGKSGAAIGMTPKVPSNHLIFAELGTWLGTRSRLAPMGREVKPGRRRCR